MSASGPTKALQDHTRIINTLLGGVEKRTLLWLAARMPAWVVPDTLTVIGLLAALVIFMGYALSFFDRNWLWLASLGFILHWFGDSLDGTLARYRKIERPRYGFFVDHIMDGVSEVFIFLGLGFSAYMRFDLALLVLIAYLLLSIYVYLVTYVNGVFRISYARMGPTEFRLIAIIANTIVYFSGNPIITFPLPVVGPIGFTFYDLLAVIVSLAIIIAFVVSTIQTAMMLSREDRAALTLRRKQERESQSRKGSKYRSSTSVAIQASERRH